MGEFSPAILEKMNHTMAYRGPDDVGSWYDGAEVGLCHRRLSIIDLSSLGRQPMWDVSRRVAITFNGEIYNYRELRADLVAKGFSFASATDTEVILNLYMSDPDGFLRRLNGMFAFAIWDSRTREMLIARDGMGVKPLYYSELPRGVIFCSAMHSLLDEESISRRLNSSAIFDYLTLLYSRSPATMLSAIAKLEPGHALRVRQGRVVRKWQWYELPFDERPFAGSANEAAEELRTRLGTAVRRQVIADVPVGAFLSGGLDSSALVSFARECSQRGAMECFTIAFRGREWQSEGMTEDLPFAVSVAQQFGVNLNVVEAGPEIVDGLEEMIFHLDEPQPDPAALHVRTICRLARERGIKVLLAGTGGDDLFSGYRRHDALMAERLWSWLPKGALSAAAFLAKHVRQNSPMKRRLAKVFASANMGEDRRVAQYFHWIDSMSRNYVLSASLRHELLDRINSAPFEKTLTSLPDEMPLLNKALFLEQKHFLTDHNLNYTDKMSMAESVEVRVPYLDPDLVKFAWSLPISMKHRRGHGKWILKEAMRSKLPASVIDRPKTGFGAPLRAWLHNELKPHVEEYLSAESIRARGLFDSAGVRRLIAMDKSGTADGAYPIFSLLCIELWCRLFIDGGWRRVAARIPDSATRTVALTP